MSSSQFPSAGHDLASCKSRYNLKHIPVLFLPYIKGYMLQVETNLYSQYKKKLCDYDVNFHGATQHQHGQPEPAPRPLLQRFRGYGGLCQGQLEAGQWGDLSPHLHSLLRTFAEARVLSLSRARGWEMGSGELGMVMGEVKRSMSVTVVRSQALCLLEI